MKFLEVRRHTMRTKPGQHLSQEGVDLARRVGDGLPEFDLVVTSTIPRAFETAIAMGYAVDEQLDELWELTEEVDVEVQWEFGFAEVGKTVKKGGATARYAEKQARLWLSIAKRLPEGGNTLVITHGGIVEAGAVGSLPNADHASWGGHIDYCEGVRLAFDGVEFTDVEVLRVDHLVG